MSICRILSLAAVTAGLILSSMASGNAQAAGIHWEYDLQNAATQSGRTGRPMLLKFTASWCGYCRKMKKETFNDPRIVEHVTECFIPVEVDADRNQKLVQAIGIRGLPTTVIVSPDLKVVRKLTGYQTADQLDQHLAQICPATHHRSADATPTVTQAAGRAAPPAAATAPPAAATAAAAAPATAPPYPDTPGPGPQPTRAAVAECSFGGRCLVRLVDGQELVDGQPQFAVDWQNHKVCFAGHEEMTRFLANPERYWPMLNGGCPVTAVDSSTLVQGLPQLGVTYRGRVWFFRSEADLERFEQNPTNYYETVMKYTSR